MIRLWLKYLFQAYVESNVSLLGEYFAIFT